MKLKKHLIPATILAAGIALISFRLMPDGPAIIETEVNQSSYEDQPPYALEYWVQKLEQPLDDGRNIIMRIHYICDDPLPTTIKVYQTDGLQIPFKDNGTYPDEEPDDGIYAAYIEEDIPAFLAQVQHREALLDQQGTFTHFNGHIGTAVSSFTHFDFETFAANGPVPLDNHLMDAADCDNGLKKQQSLFITALNVVEDPHRTYNVATSTGNPNGVWTFGNLIKNIVNAPAPASRNFLKNWVKGWVAGRIFNGVLDTNFRRKLAYDFMIKPWLEKANGVQSDGLAINVNSDPNAWEAYWDNTPEDSILYNAPFKLMAIVNRLDLRGNTAYNSTVNEAGETRFIYTLIAPIDYTITNMGTVPKGTVPYNAANNFLNNSNFLDWQGMNVIIEYGNPQTNVCDMQKFGKKWLDLSDPDFDDPFSSNSPTQEVFNDSLEAITHQVIDAGKGPNGKRNGSCLNRIRTNERIFFPAVGGNGVLQEGSWPASDWEMSQFELDNNGQLMPIAVTNTPMPGANYSSVPFPILGDERSLMSFISGAVPVVSSNNAAALIDWVYKNKIRVAAGAHLIPPSYTTTNSSPVSFKLANTAQLTGEQIHFWDLFWDANTPNYTALPQGSNNVLARTLRRQLSLNTCQGCHAGENKTFFTMVRPVGYGVPTDYWNAIPETDHGNHDGRFVTNTGSSYENGQGSNNYKEYHNAIAGMGTTFTGYEQRVSAFLTGRVYRGNGDWADDNADNGQEDARDNKFENNSKDLFYVFDPANNKFGSNLGDDVTRPNPGQMFGYNDLDNRRVKLCNFVNLFCVNGVFGLMSRIDPQSRHE